MRAAPELLVDLWATPAIVAPDGESGPPSSSVQNHADIVVVRKALAEVTEQFRVVPGYHEQMPDAPPRPLATRR